jgi:STE24 endopeptidase
VSQVPFGRSRLPLALVAAVLVAEAANMLMRPRSGVVDPVPVSARSYFTQEQIDRARGFRRPQLALFGGSLIVQAGVLVLLVRRPPRRAAARLARGPLGRPLLGAATVGAALSLATGLAPLPISAVSHQRAVDVGLSTQTWAAWVADRGRSEAIGAALAGAGALLVIALARRFPRHWWAPAAAVTVVVGAGFVYAGPIVLDPVFNRFEPLPAGQARADVLELADRAGVDVGEVFVMDASRRTTAANAYVAGLGPTKRVVIYDTLLERFTRDEVRLVVAHELGHVHHRDLRNGLLWLALVAPFGLLAIQRLTERLTSARGTAAMLPALALSLMLVSTGLSWVSNRLSREVEARADTYALRLTGEAEAFIAFERRIAAQNVADPDPPGWVTAILATHPPAVERIGAGVAWARGARAGAQVEESDAPP